VKLRADVQAAFEAVVKFQTTAVAEVQRIVEAFLPQDFRVTMLRYARDRKEKASVAEVDAYMSAGGSIDGKYKLLLAQQTQRRESFVQMASAEGVWRTLITWLGGVPSVLLDFIRQLNDPQGPMEEYRLAYGPYYYALTRFAIDMQIVCRLLVEKKGDEQFMIEALSKLVVASATYRSAMETFMAFCLDVLRNSPFFITDPTSLANGRDKPKEVMVEKWSFYELPINVQKGDLVKWEFSTKNNVDISFGVFVARCDGTDRIEIVPLKRVNSHLEVIRGQHVATAEGLLILKWDNTYSYFTSKSLQYKAELFPAEAANNVDALPTSGASNAPAAPETPKT